ncbi:hypothetical protein GWK47_010145 [Chionoecetes opilio]|uniref:Uncharacterized protein n=1 Tax=Chionoecetes opilio TaxID=41210 RepID=A0A8J4Y7E6_CHIOP|nr:hypothetical protein GWK47_010145 [Chionoecetes opilio]
MSATNRRSSPTVFSRRSSQLFLNRGPTPPEGALDLYLWVRRAANPATPFAPREHQEGGLGNFFKLPLRVVGPYEPPDDLPQRKGPPAPFRGQPTQPFQSAPRAPPPPSRLVVLQRGRREHNPPSVQGARGPVVGVVRLLQPHTSPPASWGGMSGRLSVPPRTDRAHPHPHQRGRTLGVFTARGSRRPTSSSQHATPAKVRQHRVEAEGSGGGKPTWGHLFTRRNCRRGEKKGAHSCGEEGLPTGKTAEKWCFCDSVARGSPPPPRFWLNPRLGQRAASYPVDSGQKLPHSHSLPRIEKAFELAILTLFSPPSRKEKGSGGKMLAWLELPPARAARVKFQASKSRYKELENGTPPGGHPQPLPVAHPATTPTTWPVVTRGVTGFFKTSALFDLITAKCEVGLKISAQKSRAMLSNSQNQSVACASRSSARPGRTPT